MGAGKTTVVSPLINLMVADGKNLMIQVVPPQLLEFSRSRLRETFSSIMQKRIYTFHFDRSSKIDPQTFQKFQNAIRTAGVIVTTPTSIKSLMLKYVFYLFFLLVHCFFSDLVYLNYSTILPPQIMTILY